MATQLATIDQGQLPAVSAEGERFALRQRQARMFAMSPLVPQHLRNGTPEQAVANCWIALTLAEAMGEVPLIVMQNIHVVHGTAGFKTEYKIARANTSGIFKGRIDWRVDKGNPQNLSVEAFATLKETGQEVSVTCDMAMAKAEGWTKNTKYQTMPEVMLRYRSASFLIRFYAGDVMLGYQTVEEIEDVALSASELNAEPLTAQMLIDQSQPGTLHAGPAHDPETGEVLNEATSAGPEPRLPEGMEPEQQQDEQTSTTRHPGEDRADSIIAEMRAANAVIDINSAFARGRADLEAMPEEIAQVVRDERARLIKAIEGERAKAKPEPVE